MGSFSVRQKWFWSSRTCVYSLLAVVGVFPSPSPSFVTTILLILQFLNELIPRHGPQRRCKGRHESIRVTTGEHFGNTMFRLFASMVRDAVLRKIIRPNPFTPVSTSHERLFGISSFSSFCFSFLFPHTSRHQLHGLGLVLVLGPFVLDGRGRSGW